MSASPARRLAERWGRRAEALAAIWLNAKGYRILARGWRTPQGEVDLIARRGRVVAAIEVKSRRDSDLAIEAVTPRQRRRITRAALTFLAHQRDAPRLSLRFDVVVVVPWRLPHHIVGAWEPDQPRTY
jgi:putative endonuclease